MHEGNKHSLQDRYTDDKSIQHENAVTYLYSLLTTPIKPIDRRTATLFEWGTSFPKGIWHLLARITSQIVWVF